MEYAFNLSIGEIVNVDDMVTYFPHTLRVHRYICPNCKKNVNPYVSEQISNHFKHKDESPDCEFYFGGENNTNTIKSIFYYLNFNDLKKIFRFIGFEPFSLNNTKFSKFEEIIKIPRKYYPDLYYGEYLLWVKSIYDFKIGNIDPKKLIKCISRFSKYFRPIFFISNPNFEMLGDNLPHPIIKTLNETYKSVIFEADEKCSLSIDKVKIWLMDSLGRLKCPGRASIYNLVKKTRFSYNSLRELMDTEKSFFVVEPKEYSDPEHTFRDELLELKITCGNCSRDHILPIVINFNDKLVVYKTQKNRTFSYLKNLFKFRCNFCKNYFFTFEQMQEAWVNAQVTKKKESIQIELRNILKEKLHDDILENNQQRQKVLIIQGDYIGKIGLIHNIEGKLLKVRLVDSNETINLSEDFILNL